jgi:hypothetical protein
VIIVFSRILSLDRVHQKSSLTAKMSTDDDKDLWKWKQFIRIVEDIDKQKRLSDCVLIAEDARKFIDELRESGFLTREKKRYKIYANLRTKIFSYIHAGQEKMRAAVKDHFLIEHSLAGRNL